jgi:hypothetical protein
LCESAIARQLEEAFADEVRATTAGKTARKIPIFFIVAQSNSARFGADSPNADRTYRSVACSRIGCRGDEAFSAAVLRADNKGMTALTVLALGSGKIVHNSKRRDE